LTVGKAPVRGEAPAERTVTINCAPNDATRLLRAINMDQAHGRVGTLVFPLAAARLVGLEPGTERYEEALWHLLWEGALAVNEGIPLQVAAMLPFGRVPYRLAPAAIRMLERA
jgi:hypothetical protein